MMSSLAADAQEDGTEARSTSSSPSSRRMRTSQNVVPAASPRLHVLSRHYGLIELPLAPWPPASPTRSGGWPPFTLKEMEMTPDPAINAFNVRQCVISSLPSSGSSVTKLDDATMDVDLEFKVTRAAESYSKYGCCRLGRLIKRRSRCCLTPHLPDAAPLQLAASIEIMRKKEERWKDGEERRLEEEDIVFDMCFPGGSHFIFLT
uniref:Uncharacterized protein n=1 Tax=Oryza rufipogon TaxID=4529 RepID=A0A0E0NYU6_ORYRU